MYVFRGTFGSEYRGWILSANQEGLILNYFYEVDFREKENVLLSSSLLQFFLHNGNVKMCTILSEILVVWGDW